MSESYCLPFQEHMKLVRESPAPWPQPPCLPCAMAHARRTRAADLRNAAQRYDNAADAFIRDTHPLPAAQRES